MRLNEKISNVIEKGLEKACHRLKRVTNENWEIYDIKITPIKPEERDSICVYLTTESDYDFSGVLAVSFDDSKEILKCFLKNYLPEFNTIEMIEFFINELGNIVLNACLSEFANAAGLKIIPHSPKTIKGRESFIIENIIDMFEKSKDDVIISSQVILKIKKDIVLNIYCFISGKIFRGL